MSRINQFLSWRGDKFLNKPLRASDVGKFVKHKVMESEIDAQQSVTSYMGDVWRSLILLSDDLEAPVVTGIAAGEITKSVTCQNLKLAVKNESAQARFMHMEDEARLLSLSSRLAPIAVLWLSSGMRISGVLNLNVIPVWHPLFLTLSFRNKTTTKAVASLPCMCGLGSVTCMFCAPTTFPKLPITRGELTKILTRAQIPSGSFRRTLAATFLKCSPYMEDQDPAIRELYVKHVLRKFGWTFEKLLLRYAKGFQDVPEHTLPRVAKHLVESWDQFFRKHIHGKPKTFGELKERMLLLNVRHKLPKQQKLALGRLF